MKRFFAFVLALMLCVSLLSITASATETAALGLSSAQTEAGNTVTLYVSINAPAIGGIDIGYTYDNSMLELVEFAAVSGGWTVGTHAIWECGSTTNGALSGTILSLTFKVKDSAQVGDSANVSVYASGYKWNEDGMSYEALAISGATGTVTVACAHAWDAGVVTTPATCTQTGLMTYTCTKCGETKTEVIPAAEHAWENVWIYDEANHWHECSVCGEIKDEAAHINDVTGQKIPTVEEDGYRIYGCVICGRYDHTEPWPYGEEPKVGDIRPMMMLGVVGVLSVLAAASYVFKRKNII